MYCFVATSMKYKDSSIELLLLNIIAVYATFPWTISNLQTPSRKQSIRVLDQEGTNASCWTLK